MNLPSIGNISVASVVGQCTNRHRIFATDNTENVNYPQTKDLWASDFIEECPFKRLGLLSSPSV